MKNLKLFLKESTATVTKGWHPILKMMKPSNDWGWAFTFNTVNKLSNATVVQVLDDNGDKRMLSVKRFTID